MRKHRKAVDPSKLAGVKVAGLPRHPSPALATLVDAAPPGDAWLHELKLDGYRMLCVKDGQRVKFLSRNEHDWTAKFRSLVPAIQKLNVEQAILDGEVCVFDENGLSHFQALQNMLRDASGTRLSYVVFDLLYLDGHDLRPATLEDRKRMLEGLVPGQRGKSSPLRYSEHVVGQGQQVFENACRLGAEGIISKRRDDAYPDGRSKSWLKVKCLASDEFILAGYTRSDVAGRGFASLLLAYHDPQGRLHYAGRVGTGFNERTMAELAAQLRKLEIKESPFDSLPRDVPRHDVRWVKPRLVAEIAYTEWTGDRHLRHPSYKGLRPDKSPQDIVYEAGTPTMAKKKAKPAKTSKSPARVKPAKSSEPDLPAGVRITHPERLLWPEAGVSKLGLAEYYTQIADWILPELVDRPLSLVRCPDGSEGECFFQKHAIAGLPKSVRRVSIKEDRGTGVYLAVDDLEGLLALVQFSTLELHVWGARTDKLEQPDRVVLDLDPDPSVPWKKVVEAALDTRDFLARLGLESFVKTTGGKGLHVTMPLTRRLDWDEVKEFAKLVAERMVALEPNRFTSNMSKAKRKGKIFVDYLRNGRGATFIAPYSTRRHPTATVAVPLTWDELPKVSGGDLFTVETVPARLAKLKRDPWAKIDKTRQSITAKVVKGLR